MTSTLSQLLFVYVFGGLTFIPLVLAAVLVPAWLNLPKVEEGGSGEEKRHEDQADEDEEVSKKLKAAQDEHYTSDGDDGTAAGTFAVLRKYDLPAANTALATRNAGQGAGGPSNATDGTGEGHAGSESVYQSMYRSVFDRSRTPPTNLSNTSDDESSPASDAKARRRAARPAPANVFYIVLRHGHLMLYDSPAQLEVRHVISLAHHNISLSDGETGELDNEVMTDGDLFIKRTAILLSPRAASATGKTQARPPTPKPFYLFTGTSIQKESFYQALLLASPTPPTPQPLDPHDLIKLQTTLHSTIITPETRALNAIISRIFLALSGTDQLKDFFRAKIEKKISRVPKPGFINALALQAIDLGAAAPVIANLRLKDLNVSGDVTISCDVRYAGGISLTLAAQAKLDLGPRFKARTVDLLLSSSLKRLSGHMLIRIKPSPSNRLWFCFDGMPDMEIKIEPVVSSRQITYGFILRQIEERIRAVVGETLVKPNWDDIPFFDTRTQKVRGGIWATQGEDSEDSEIDALVTTSEKTRSMPTLPHMDADTEAASSGTETPGRDREAELKRRSVMSLPAETSSQPQFATTDMEEHIPASPPAASRPLRSPSLASPSASAPSVALDDSAANVDPTPKPLPQKVRTWGRRQMASPPTRKEAVDAMREMRDRTFHAKEADSAESGIEAVEDRGRTTEEDDGPASERTTPHRTDTGLSTASAASSASASTAETAASMRSDGSRQKKAANLLAAATTATTAAKNWSWNAIQNRTARNAAGRRPSEASYTSPQHEPMGRGQPLPPPGMPLPGPQKEKSLWAGSGFGVPGLTGSVKRKPLLPRKPAESVHEDGGEDEKGRDVEGGDEFGEWAENSGDRRDEDERHGSGETSAEEEREKQVPPPLPRRRPPGQSSTPADTEGHNSSEGAPTHALDAAKLATNRAALRAHDFNATRDSVPASGEVDLSTATAQLDSKSSSITDLNTTHATPSTVPSALPAKPGDPATSSSDPEDLVVVAAPTEESGRNTPVPSPTGPRTQEEEKLMPRYDGEEWGAYDDDEEEEEKEEEDKDKLKDGGDEGSRKARAAIGEERWEEEDDEEEEEALPKASFSRSRGDEGELHY